MNGFIPGLGMQEILLLALFVAIPLGAVATAFVVMRLTRKNPREREMDERENIDDRD